MSTLLIRDLDDDVMARLRASAAAHQRSMAAEVRVLLDEALSPARVQDAPTRYRADAAEPAWQPVWGAVPGLRANCPVAEDTAPVFPEGVPWHPQDPV